MFVHFSLCCACDNLDWLRHHLCTYSVDGEAALRMTKEVYKRGPQLGQVCGKENVNAFAEVVVECCTAHNVRTKAL